jgi:hypothetical protein
MGLLGFRSRKWTYSSLVTHAHICSHMLSNLQNEQNGFIRKAQANRDGLYLNLPQEWCELMDVKKSDPLSCSIIRNDNEFYLLVHKIQESL